MVWSSVVSTGKGKFTTSGVFVDHKAGDGGKGGGLANFGYGYVNETAYSGNKKLPKVM